jgi:hypothetical protein
VRIVISERGAVGRQRVLFIAVVEEGNVQDAAEATGPVLFPAGASALRIGDAAPACRPLVLGCPHLAWSPAPRTAKKREQHAPRLG